jgi:hypothetical protein
MQHDRLHRPVFHRIIEFIFYGNYFYGICAIAVMLETAVQMSVPFQGTFIYFMVFITTVLFYNYPYARNYSSPNNNPRTQWYTRNHNLVIKTQTTLTLLLLFSVVRLFIKYHQEIIRMSKTHWFLLLIFPTAGAMYYGANFISDKYNLRQIGWLKPFIIGFVWAGVATVYPILYYYIVHSKNYEFSIMENLLFLKNFMFISLLAIMFDIKDFAADSNSRLNTLVVKIGLRKTIFYVLLPLTVLGVLTFISYAVTHQFSILKMILIMIPFFLLIVAAWSLRKRRTLMYYLIVIDGLLIIKAAFGILATAI